MSTRDDPKGTADRWRRVEALYHQLLARSPDERAAALVAACPDDPELAAEVRALLDSPESAAEFLSRPAMEAAAGLASGTSSSVTGRRLGAFEVEGLLGVGGMGEVYRGRDTRLGRAVAIKILRRPFQDDPDRLARFEREARVLASLNHPNIGALYGLEDAGDFKALVLELVEGEDLSRRIARGAIPVDEALPIARQIAEAIEAAHEQGVIHRDLKPANIKLRADGTVKVLDFGLAKAMEPTSAGHEDPNESPTLSARATRTGMIIGTAGYLAPEQARGKAVDRRADVWSFGVVVFEMLTGRRAFPGENRTDIILSVVSKEPDWTALPAVPLGLRLLLARCLKKDPKARLQSIGDARVQIEELLSSAPEEMAAAASGPMAPPPVAAPRSVWSRALPWAKAAVTLGLAIALILLWAFGPARTLPPSTPLRFTPLSFEQGGQTGAVWSPDGKAVAYGARQKQTDPFQVYVRYLESPLATQITHLPEDASPIEWTSTGRIVFGSRKTPAGLWSVSPVGGEPEPWLLPLDPAGVSRALAASRVSVSQDGTATAVLFSGDDGVHGVWISSPPGAALKLYEPAPFASRGVFNSPQMKFSPDGKQILLIRHAGQGEEAWLLPYPANASNPPRRIFPDMPAYAGTPWFSWMPDNRHVVMSTTPGEGVARQLYMADTVTGAFALFSSGTTAQAGPAVSPDGSKLVFVEASSDYDVVSLDLATAAVTPLIATQRSEQMPAWASKEPALVYVTNRNGGHEIWLQQRGQLDRPLVTARDFPPDTTQSFIGPSLSPDATRLIYVREEKSGSTAPWMSAVAGGAPVRVVRGSAEEDCVGSWSPDGNWYVYLHGHEGRVSLNKVKTTGQAEPEVLKADVKVSAWWVPVWSPSGEWILYQDDGVKLVSPDGKATRDVSATIDLAYAFSADGKTLYGMRQVAARGPVELFSMRVAGGTQKTIGFLRREYLPVNSLTPAVRLSLAPGGKSVTYATVKSTSNLWLAEGLDAIRPR